MSQIIIDKLPQILWIVSESPLAWSAFIILIIAWLIIKLQLGKVERLAREIRNLSEQDRFRAIERLYSDVHTNSPESFLRARRQQFRFAYYFCSLCFILVFVYILLFYANKIIPSLLPFMPPPTEIVREIPESGTVNSNAQGFVNFKRFLINFETCQKEATSSISCTFKIENQAGDRDFSVHKNDSRIVENSGEDLPCKSVQISSNQARSSSSTKMISKIPTSAIYNFDGVAENVKSVAALEAVVRAEGEYLTLQYKNVPLQ